MSTTITPLYTVQISASNKKWRLFYLRVEEEGKKSEIKATLHFISKDKAEQYVSFAKQWLEADERTHDIDVYLEDEQVEFLVL